MEKLTNEIADKVKAWLDNADVKEAIAATKKAADTDTGTFEVIITTENLDRYQEVVSLQGWELEHYKANPVVLWGHNHNNLIGVCTDLDIVDGKMIAKGKFAPTEEGQEKRKLYEMGFLKATSVGFIEKEREGNLITKAELLEFSFVSVPANPYALSLAMEKGLQVNELVEKGILSIREIETKPEETDEVDTSKESEEETEPETTEPEPETEPEVEEKSLSDVLAAIKDLTNTVKDLSDSIKDSALEDTKEGEPEGTEEPEADEDQKTFDEFSDKRKTIQKAATIIGDVLADMRQEIEAKKQSA